MSLKKTSGQASKPQVQAQQPVTSQDREQMINQVRLSKARLSKPQHQNSNRNKDHLSIERMIVKVGKLVNDEKHRIKWKANSRSENTEISSTLNSDEQQLTNQEQEELYQRSSSD